MPRQTDVTMGRYLQYIARNWIASHQSTAKALAQLVGVTGAQLDAVVNRGEGAGTKTVRGFARFLKLEEWELRRDAAAWERANPVPLEAPVEVNGPLDLERVNPAFRTAIEQKPGRWTQEEIRAAIAARGATGFSSMTPEAVIDFIDDIARANRRATREAELAKLAPPVPLLPANTNHPAQDEDEVEARRRARPRAPKRKK